MSAFKVIYDNRVIGCACDNLAAVAREAQRPDTEVVAAHVPIRAAAGSGGAGCEVSEIKESVVGLV